MGGEGGGVGLVHDQAGVMTRYTGIPDPAHVLFAKGLGKGEEQKTDNHRIRGPIILNMSNRVLSYLNLVLTRWEPVLSYHTCGHDDQKS